MSENEVSQRIVHACYIIHSKLGPGLFESVYEEILSFELKRVGLKIERQKVIPVYWNSIKMDQGFRADLIINEKVLVEIKSVENIIRVHQKQVQTYLKLTGIKLGLLVNFNESLIKNGIQRIVNGL